MPMTPNDELYGKAFRALHQVSESIKSEGVSSEMKVWALMFVVMQDLQAAALGMGSPEHEETLVMQRDRLAEDVEDLRGLPPASLLQRRGAPRAG